MELACLAHQPGISVRDDGEKCGLAGVTFEPVQGNLPQQEAGGKGGAVDVVEHHALLELLKRLPAVQRQRLVEFYGLWRYQTNGVGWNLALPC